MATRAAKTAKAAKDVYRGYMPIDLPQHRPPRKFKPWWKVVGKPMVTLYPKEQIEGYSEEPEYPPLNDGSRKGVRTQTRLDWYESLKAIPTNEEKLLEIGRHCQHYIANINNWMPSYNSLPMIQYLTRTNVINSLPDSYKTNSKNHNEAVQNDDDELVQRVKQLLLDQIAFDKYESNKRGPGFVSRSITGGDVKQYVSDRFIQNIVSSVKKILASEVNQQLLDYQYDLSPAIRSWWYHSGFQPPNNKVFYRSRKDDDGNINQMIQLNGSSSLNIRGDSLMEPVISQTDSLVTDTSLIQNYCHPLKNFGAQFKFKWPVALPGFWFEEKPKFDFPHTCFLSTDCLELRNKQKFKLSKHSDDEENCLNGQAILTAFSWLNSLSMYHGYTPFQELDYPFTCQVVTTDGQDWLFNVYQLNCHTFHRDLGGPKRNNICWTSGRMQLFNDYNPQNGNFTGVNDDVVRLLIRFMAQQTSPEYTSQLNLRPYLGVDVRTDEEKKETQNNLRRTYEQRNNKWLAHQWSVPLYEHIFFRSPQGRNRLTHMKARWHIPKPLPPKIFE